MGCGFPFLLLTSLPAAPSPAPGPARPCSCSTRNSGPASSMWFSFRKCQGRARDMELQKTNSQVKIWQNRSPGWDGSMGLEPGSHLPCLSTLSHPSPLSPCRGDFSGVWGRGSWLQHPKTCVVVQLRDPRGAAAPSSHTHRCPHGAAWLVHSYASCISQEGYGTGAVCCWGVAFRSLGSTKAGL